MKSLITISRRVLWSGFLFAIGFLGILAVTGHAQGVGHAAVNLAGLNPLSWLGGFFTSALGSLIEGPVIGEAASVLWGLVQKFATPLYAKLPDSVHRVIGAVLAAIGFISIGGQHVSLTGGFDANWLAGLLSAVVAWLGIYMQQHKTAITAATKSATPAPGK